MVKVIDHSQTGKTKFIKGNGRKGDIPLELLDDHKNKEEIRADSFLEKVNTKEVENKKPYTNFLKKKKTKQKQSKVFKTLKKLIAQVNSMKLEKSEKELLNKSINIIKSTIGKHTNV